MVIDLLLHILPPSVELVVHAGAGRGSGAVYCTGKGLRTDVSCMPIVVWHHHRGRKEKVLTGDHFSPRCRHRVPSSIVPGKPHRSLGEAATCVKGRQCSLTASCACVWLPFAAWPILVVALQGIIVERLYREVRSYAIPGGSEEIMNGVALLFYSNSWHG